MDASQMAIDTMVYVREIGPILLILGAVSFADLVVLFLIRLMRAGKIGKMKW